MDASHEKFRGLFMGTLKEQLAKVGRSIDYILVSHTEPDHSGAPGAVPLPGNVQHHTYCQGRTPLTRMCCGRRLGCHCAAQDDDDPGATLLVVAARPVLLARA